jgi:hypothetical protein
MYSSDKSTPSVVFVEADSDLETAGSKPACDFGNIRVCGAEALTELLRSKPLMVLGRRWIKLSSHQQIERLLTIRT